MASKTGHANVGKAEIQTKKYTWQIIRLHVKSVKFSVEKSELLQHCGVDNARIRFALHVACPLAIIKSEKMKKLLIVFGLLISIVCQGQQITRELKIVEFSGRGYELGLQHGKELKKEIGEIITAWKKNASNSLGKDAMG